MTHMRDKRKWKVSSYELYYKCLSFYELQLSKHLNFKGALVLNDMDRFKTRDSNTSNGEKNKITKTGTGGQKIRKGAFISGTTKWKETQSNIRELKDPYHLRQDRHSHERRKSVLSFFTAFSFSKGKEK